MNEALWNLGTRMHVQAYRLSRGRVGGKLRGVSILLLNHVGRRSGQKRTTPLMYVRDGENFVIIASKGGAPRHPAWFHNLRANPVTTVEVDGKRVPVVAREATPEERPRLWKRATDVWSDYDAYQARTRREIPVVVLEPDAPARPA